MVFFGQFCLKCSDSYGIHPFWKKNHFCQDQGAFKQQLEELEVERAAMVVCRPLKDLFGSGATEADPKWLEGGDGPDVLKPKIQSRICLFFHCNFSLL